MLVENGSDKTLERVEFTLPARAKGRSTNLAKYHSYFDDHIIEPQTGFANCWAVPLEKSMFDDLIPEQSRKSYARELEWSILYKTMHFRD